MVVIELKYFMKIKVKERTNGNWIFNYVGDPVWLFLGIGRVERMQKNNQQDAEAKQKIYERGGQQ